MTHALPRGLVARSRAVLPLAWTLLLLAPATRADEPRGYALSFHAVGSPDTGIGPNRVGEPGFVPPVALSVQLPPEAACLSRKGAGSYEALVRADGTVAGVHSHDEPVDGDRCERTRLFPYLRQWRFAPATLEGRPIAVYLWIGLEGTEARPGAR